MVFFTGCSKSPSINGLWRDDSAPPFTNCYASYASNGSDLKMMHFFQYEGKPFFEVGTGTIVNTPEGTVLKYHVKVKQTIDDWATSGYHELTLSEDGKILDGFYISEKGAKGKLKFIKRD